MFTVAVCMHDRAYGGPEEGGWYYSVGAPEPEFCRFTRGFKREGEAEAYAQRLRRHLVPRLNVGRYPVSSVLSTGRYCVEVFEGNPAPWPSERPHYE